ncbi:YmdB family metallophosphoesterase [candidate division WWE3 bacterium]|nr:YmdB family metallophosphoesterase [candidate division WWE3 bacterium]
MDTIRFLLIGDIVAKPGRQAVEYILPKLKKELEIDVVIANAENLVGGKGVSEDRLIEMMNVGVDYFTSGNHVFSRPGWEDVLANSDNGIVRPMNYPESTSGFGWLTFEVKGNKITLANLQGVEGLTPSVDNPFKKIDQFLDSIKDLNSIILLDFHAEMTSEKRAMGFYIDGRIHVMWGSHTHVPTADLQTLPNGTFYVSDLGMVGNRDSVLGVKKEIIIQRFIDPQPRRFEWEYQGAKVFNAVLVEVKNDGSISTFARVDRIIP